jgi:hypothetical protein
VLLAFRDDLHIRVALVAVDKVFEAGLRRRIVDRLGPLAGDSGTQTRQLFFQVGVQAQLVVDNDARR